MCQGGVCGLVGCFLEFEDIVKLNTAFCPKGDEDEINRLFQSLYVRTNLVINLKPNRPITLKLVKWIILRKLHFGIFICQTGFVNKILTVSEVQLLVSLSHQQHIKILSNKRFYPMSKYVPFTNIVSACVRMDIIRWMRTKLQQANANGFRVRGLASG